MAYRGLKVKTEPGSTIRKHLVEFFAGHKHTEHIWTLGPAQEEFPHLRIVEFAPGPKSDLWIYTSIGAWKAQESPRLEFLIIGPKQDQRHVELLSMTTWYHGHHGLGHGHTLPIGEPWLPNSECNYLLVSTPYPFGPSLEICNVEDWHVHILWLLPITSAERDYKVQHGLEELEQQFEKAELEYWEPKRSSVV